MVDGCLPRWMMENGRIKGRVTVTDPKESKTYESALPSPVMPVSTVQVCPIHSISYVSNCPFTGSS